MPALMLKEDSKESGRSSGSSDATLRTSASRSHVVKPLPDTLQPDKAKSSASPDAASPLVHWLQKEVSDHLLQIDKKLDLIVHRVSSSNSIKKYDQRPLGDLGDQAQVEQECYEASSRGELRSPQHYAREYKALPLPPLGASSCAPASEPEPPVEGSNNEVACSPSPSELDANSQGSLMSYGMNAEGNGMESCQASVLANRTSLRTHPSYNSERRSNVLGSLVNLSADRRTSGKANISTIFSTESHDLMYWGRSSFAAKVLQFLENPRSSNAAFIYAKIISFFILSSCLFNLFMTIRPPPLQGDGYIFFEVVFDFVFLVEALVRWTAAKNRLQFIYIPNNIIDLVGAGPPLVARIVTSDLVLPASQTRDDVRYLLLCVVPLFRLLKMLRRWEKFQLLLTSAFELVVDILPVLMVMLWLLALSFSTVIYFVERSDDNIQSLPEALWMTVVTMTTVGYGDKTPKSAAGYLVTIVLVICSALYMAVPIGIVGNTFSYIWQNRDHLLVKQQAKNRLKELGFEARDVPDLFKLFGRKDETLSLLDFQRMIADMGLGLPEERVISLFSTFDSDDSGTIGAEEFVRGIYPERYIAMYRMTDYAQSDVSSIASDRASDRPSPPRTSRNSHNSQVSTPKKISSSSHSTAQMVAESADRA